MKPDNFETLPKFQRLQYLFSNHIRNPEDSPYSIENQPGLAEIAQEVDSKRLKAYESLFFNNLYDFFSNLFPILKAIVGDTRWQEIIREYLIKHRAKSPLFHELGQEFILFLQNEFESKPGDPDYMLELAHYEWVELALSIEEQEGFLNPLDVEPDLDSAYEVSPVAAPLAYEWPVHKIMVDQVVDTKPDCITTLLAFRDEEDQVQFIELSPVLYELVQAMTENSEQATVRALLHRLCKDLGLEKDKIEGFAVSILEDLIDMHLVRPIS
ncbi:putative DNA-binding domain-containing protein [Hydrogenovibrio sp. 3SP14C1]|uniref:HvfC family RiPP maturation protein n=1 Tax=Hydrogenovibrio sp. 3SP14C1 TaxID=3038774 RepID=UPI00241646BE|nr:putative DNA-binding domain-containing protein [Hydrogenovibrio sp. 3SP14C1]MDG4812342.1 putative DNA-binding domain-containing protein [Hydrogenovibrio sp. 3SP14C1]